MIIDYKNIYIYICLLCNFFVNRKRKNKSNFKGQIIIKNYSALKELFCLLLQTHTHIHPSSPSCYNPSIICKESLENIFLS